MTLCVRSKQSRTIKTLICYNIFTSLRRIKVQSLTKQFKELFNLAELTLFFIELPENCIYLNQSELSDFFRYLIISVTDN